MKNKNRGSSSRGNHMTNPTNTSNHQTNHHAKTETKNVNKHAKSHAKSDTRKYQAMRKALPRKGVSESKRRLPPK